MNYYVAALAVSSLLVVSGCAPRKAAAPSNSTVAIPGPRPDGSILLPTQWSLRPVGKQLVLGDFPVNIALHPKGRFAAVLHCGYGTHEIIVVDFVSVKIVSRTVVEEAFYGLSFDAEGNRLFCSGSAEEVIHQFHFARGYLSDHQTIALRNAKEKGMPAGLAVDAEGKNLYVASLWSSDIARVKLGEQSPSIDRVLMSTNPPAVVEPPASAANEDTAAITKRAEALLASTSTNDPLPYAVVIDPASQRLYASLWAQAAVVVIDLNTWRESTRWTVEDHPNEMILTRSGKFLFVANANRNSVSVIETVTGRVAETLLAELFPNSPPGSTPNSLALSPDEKTLYVANANINTVAVFDVAEPGRSRSLGFIPVGWYPTSVRVSSDGKKLLVANGKGLISKANRHGPQPGQEAPPTVREYIAGLFQGTLSVIDLPAAGEKTEEQLKRWTAQAYQCAPATANPAYRMERSAGHPIPTRLGDPSPIKYCFYIIKENRTYDQMLGDMPEGNGDPAICLFPEAVTPNHHKLARDFVLLDNFYVESEVSADGHEWTMGAYATDFVEKNWPLSYGHNAHKKHVYPAEGRFRIAEPAGGYLWDRAREAGVTYRSYGEFVNNGKTADDPGTSRVPALQGHFDPWYRGFDMDYPDLKRAERFISELRRFEREGQMPQLQIIRLPNDHTSGTAAGKLSPKALVADNDLAFGMVVEAISRSKFWPQSAIFVVEDDAQNGPDHVDAHRTIAYVISPYVRRGTVDSTLYSTASMLRTMELILGLKPMSQFDAAAQPMFNSFQAKPDLRPYEPAPVTIDRTERNPKTAWRSDMFDRLDLTKEDAIDDLLLNEMIWKSVRGVDSPMPAPVRAAWVFGEREEKD